MARRWLPLARLITTLFVVTWATLVLHSMVWQRVLPDVYRTPTPPYVSVTTGHHFSLQWSTLLKEVGGRVVSFIRYGG